MEFLYIDIAAGYKVIHALYVVAGVTAVLVVWNFFSRMATLNNTKSHLMQKQCNSCGWSGRVSAHQRKCPKCNATLI